MIEIADIRDRNSLKAWVDNQPRDVAVWITSRAVARMLPVWWQVLLSKDWTRKRSLTPIPFVWSILITSVAAFRPSKGIEKAAYSVNQPTSLMKNRFLGTFAANSSFAVGDPLLSALQASFIVADKSTTGSFLERFIPLGTSSIASRLGEFSASTKYIGAFTAWKAIRTDAEQTKNGTLPDALPLWPDGLGPLEDQWAKIKRQMVDVPDAADWQFWIDWYDAQLLGRTMLSDPKRTLDMLEQIALINPNKWKKGPETVNPEIRSIWELHRLRAEANALQAEKEVFLAANASMAHRGHNQPPEGLVDEQPEVARQITIVWDSLDEARDELEQDTPDKSRLRDIAERLLSALNVIVRYCGKVADATAIAAAKVGGGATGTALLDHVANNGRLMQFAKDLLTYGAG